MAVTRRTRATLLAVGVVAVTVAWWFLQPAGDRVVLDLVREVPRAKDRRPSPDAFSIVTISLGGAPQPAIFTTTPSRIKWDVRVPAGARLKVSVGLKPDAWVVEGDGVLFAIGVSDPAAGRYVELFRRVINPFLNQEDRRWRDLALDLSPYAGRTVELIFNAYAGGGTGPATSTGDLAVWGAPRIVLR